MPSKIKRRQNRLLDACIKGEYQDVDIILGEELAIDIHFDNDICLRKACAGGYKEIVEVLLAQRADVFAEFGEPIISAVRGGFVDIVKMLLDKESHVETSSLFEVDSSVFSPPKPFYATLLQQACYLGHTEVVEILLERGADLHADDDLAFLWTVQKGHPDIMKSLVAKGAAVNKTFSLTRNNDCHDGENKERSIFTPLSWAASIGNEELVEFLIQSGADVHSQRDHAIYRASENGNIVILKKLMDKGANIHVDSDYPWMQAARRGNIEMLKVLSEKVDIHIQEDIALRLACESGQETSVKELVAMGANPRVRDDEPLIKASGKGYIGIVKFLFEKGADVHSQRDSAVVEAAKGGFSDIVEYLVKEKSADITSRQGELLTYAYEQDDIDIMQMLLKNGADVHYRGDLFLRRAMDDKKIGMVELLIHDGAKVTTLPEKKVVGKELHGVLKRAYERHKGNIRRGRNLRSLH